MTTFLTTGFKMLYSRLMSTPPKSQQSSKDPWGDQTAGNDHDALSCLLLAVISEVLPAGTAFRFREVMLEKACLRQQKIVQRADVKRLDDSPYDEKAQEELPKRIAISYLSYIFSKSL